MAFGVQKAIISLKCGKIGSPIRAFDWCQNQRPWMTLKGHYALCFITPAPWCCHLFIFSFTFTLILVDSGCQCYNGLDNLISVQSSGRTRSSSVVTLARPSVSSSLQITNRSFRYASHHLWNQLPSSFRQPHCVHSPPGSPHPAHITSSQSSPSFSPSFTRSTFHSRLKAHLFHKSFPP